MNIPSFSFIRWRWLLLSLAGLTGCIGVGFLLYQATQDHDPHRTIREGYAKQQNKISPQNLQSNLPSSAIASTESNGDARKELRQITALPEAGAEKEPVEVLPPLVMSTDLQERKVLEIDPTPPPLFEEPAIPHALLDQTPPSKNPSELVKLKINPGRYRFNNLSPEAITGKVVVSEDSATPDFNLETFAPEMEDIDLALMDHIHSSSLELDVAAGVWTPFYFQGKKLLEIGDKLRGQATPGRQRDRLIVKFTKIIRKDGRSLPVQGISLAVDGTLGIPGEKVGNIFQAAAGPLLAELIKGVSESFQDREKGIVSGVGAGVVSDLPVKNMKNAGIRGSQRVLDKIEELMTEELEENKPYLFVRAGTRLRCRLQAAIDVSQADYGK